jgi:hypothetical protein
MYITVAQLRESMNKAAFRRYSPSLVPALQQRKNGLGSLDMASFVFLNKTEFDITIPHTESPMLVALQGVANSLAEKG